MKHATEMEPYAKLKAGKGELAGADPEDKYEYKVENIFFVPQDARWSNLQANAKPPTIGKTVDGAMDADDFDFAERFTDVKAEFEEPLKEETILSERILENLAQVKIDA